MAKPKLRKLSQKQLKRLKKDKRLKRLWPLGLFLVGLLTGLMLAWLQPTNLRPKHLVWAAGENTDVPADLAEFLQAQDSCLNPRGGVTPGVGLWGVYQVERQQFAKVAYGCGVGLTRYVMAVKADDGWRLLSPNEYFATGSAFLPRCEQIEQHRIPKQIEPFCIPTGAGPRENIID